MNKIFPLESGTVVSESLSNTNTVPLKNDMFIQSNPKEKFFSLLEDFHGDPSTEIREQAIKLLKENPHILNQPFDKDFEAYVYRWRDLLSVNQKEVSLIIFEMMKILKDENKELLKRFLSLGIEINLRNFISINHNGADANCSTIIAFGDPYTDEEKMNLLIERQSALNELLGLEGVELSQKKFVKVCLIQLQLHLNKMAPKSIETEQRLSEESESSPEQISQELNP
jgi:hypothetical protein